MSDYEYDDENTEGPKALREHAKKLEKQLAESLKANEALQGQVTDLTVAVKKSSLTDLLKQAGVDPKFVVKADRDGVDATEDGVKAWIEENRDFYNFGKPAEKDGAVGEETEPTGEPTIPEGMEEGVRAGQGLDASGVSPSEVSVMSKLQSIDPSKLGSREELNAALAAAGVQLD